MMIDNSSYFVSGMRKTPQEDYQYLKLPADANGEINGFMIFRELLHSPQILNNAIKRVVAQSFPEGGEKSQIYFEGPLSLGSTLNLCVPARMKVVE